MSRGRRAAKQQAAKSAGKRSIPIPLEPLKEGHRMDPQERLFLEAAEKGDRHTMIRCLQGPHAVNVNCTNMLGRSAIQIAVDNENSEIVELLLKQDAVHIGDALLYAVREGVYRIVELLIDHPSITPEMLGDEWSRFQLAGGGEESCDYSPDISPVILAAHCNQFEILQLLLSRGATIATPHHLTCACSQCRQQQMEDSLRHSLFRIHAYRALSSPAWISLTSGDPVLTAFRLSWELEGLALKENEFKDTYGELSVQCKKYTCDLLDQCRSSEEVIAVLNKDTESEDEVDGSAATERLTLARLKLALKYEQKRFVAHPHCQQLLTSIWYEGLPGWRKRSVATKLVIITSLICLMPLMAVYYLLLPGSKIGQLLRSPFMKFMYHSASFGLFLLLLILASANVGTEEGLRRRQQERGPAPSPLEWLIVFYVTGFIWSECKQLWDEGLKAYVRQWWNWLDFIMLSLYLCTLSLRAVAFCLSRRPDVYGPAVQPRSSWPDTDPTLISEGVFAVANVFSFARIIYLFQANPQLGPLQISLGCMLIDIGKFLFIFFLILTSFACGLNQLYYYYSNTDMVEVERTIKVNNETIVHVELVQASDYENAFTPLWTSYSTLFWSLFGLTPLAAVRDGHMHPFTKRMGECLLGAYHAMAIIVLINMLIAMMSNSFQNIEDHADREWKFARSQLWMGYFDEGSTLPPPFNLIISPKSVWYCVLAAKRLVVRCIRGRKTAPHRNAENSVKRTSYRGGKQSQLRRSQPKYQDVMRRLVSRYIHQMKKQMRQDGVNEDDLLEIKQDISSLRYELREDRKREAARATGHLDNLRRDIMRSLRGLGAEVTPSPPTHRVAQCADTSPRNCSFSSAGDGCASATTLSGLELQELKNEIILSLRREIGMIAREIGETVARQPLPDPCCTPQISISSANPPANPENLLALQSDLYQTHLYTQL